MSFANFPALWTERAPLAGLLAAASAAWWACDDSMRAMTALSLAALAAKYVALAMLACFGSWVIAVLVSNPRRPACLRHSLLGSLVVAAWMPPLALYMQRRSAWVLLPAIFVSALWTIATRSHAKATSPQELDAPFPGRTLILSAPAAWGRMPAFRQTFTGSVFLQGSFALVIFGQPIWAAPLAIIAAAILAGAAYASAAGVAAPCSSVRGSATPATVVVAAAAAFTGAALLPHLARWTVGGGAGDVETFSLPQLPEPQQGSGNSAADDKDVHIGVIIWPEEEPSTRLIAPLPAVGPAFGKKRTEHPLSIPFFGAYWIYRPPDKRPPPNSIILRGSPARRGLRSTDRLALKMEAHQNFGTFLPASCCSRAELAIRNDDRFTHTVTLELLLTDTERKTTMSLGRQPLPSRASPRTRGGESQTISFDMPGSGSLTRFDEATVIFHLDRFRADEAARVGIERFVFVPRGQ